jgi:hypothetical protein
VRKRRGCRTGDAERDVSQNGVLCHVLFILLKHPDNTSVSVEQSRAVVCVREFGVAAECSCQVWQFNTSRYASAGVYAESHDGMNSDIISLPSYSL